MTKIPVLVIATAILLAAQPARERLTLGEETLTVSVQDDGRGFTITPGAHRGIGLIGMEERISELGGELKISSQPGKGTIVIMELPIAQGAAV